MIRTDLSDLWRVIVRWRGYLPQRLAAEKERWSPAVRAQLEETLRNIQFIVAAESSLLVVRSDGRTRSTTAPPAWFIFGPGRAYVDYVD